MLDWLLGGGGAAALIAAIVGWVYAYRARGEALDARTAANVAGDRARIADARADAAQAAIAVADARAETARAQLTASERTRSALSLELDRTRADRQALLDAVAKSGAPVGPDMYDRATDKLFKHPVSGDAGAASAEGSSPGDDRPGLPANPSRAPNGKA